MTYEEICNLVQYNERESILYFQNEIFDEIKSSFKNSSHIATTYSYLFFVTWLYRYTRHVNGETLIDNSKIKEVLGYNSKNQTLDYIIKKDGWLDMKRLTISTKDIPVSWNFSKDNNEGLSFTMSSEFDDLADYLPKMSNRFFIKYPTKAFSRETVIKNEEYDTSGTFYDIENTHLLNFNIFAFSMSNMDIGCIGFYLYSYIKRQDYSRNGDEGYDVSIDNLSKETGIARKTLNRYLGALKSYNMISFEHNQEFFAIGLKEIDRRSNTYYAEDYDSFNNKPLPFKRIDVMKKEDYMKLLKEEKESQEAEKKKSKLLDFDEGKLPF